MNYYQLLKISKNSSTEEIKKAFRKAAELHHPDKGGSTPMFQQIQDAYTILKDPEKRKNYDEKESKKPVESLRDSMKTIVTYHVDEVRRSKLKP